MTDISELNALRARIDQLEAEARRANDERTEQMTTRRGMLRLAGAAAVGGLATVIASDPVAATDSSAVLAGVSVNTATLPTGIAVAAASTVYGLACYESGLGALNADLGRPAVFGHATGTAFTKGVAGHNTSTGGSAVYGLDGGSDPFSTAVRGKSTNGTGGWFEGSNVGLYGSGGEGVVGFSANGVGMATSGAQGAIILRTFGVGQPPARATPFQMRTLETDGDGNVWYCYEDGTPGKWRKLAGPGTGGAFHPITPTRVYDSRVPVPSPGLLTAGNNRLVSVADGRDNNGTVTTPDLVPAGATAVAANITVTGTTGVGGYLAVNPGGITAVTASTINWFGAGQNIANGVTLTLNATRELTVVCGAGGGSTHFIVDIAGYYL